MFHSRQSRSSLLILGGIILISSIQSVRGDIYQWEWIDPAHPELGKKQSATLCPGGAGVNAEPHANFPHVDLTKAYLIGANLDDCFGPNAWLVNADMSQANLSDAYLIYANLTDANLTDALVSRVNFGATTSSGFTSGQLYSTASYKAKSLAGIGLDSNEMPGWDFAQQNLAGASMRFSNLNGANFAQANLTGAAMYSSSMVGANFGQANMPGAVIYGSDMTSANLFQANLRGATLGPTLISANLSQADLTNASMYGSNLSSANLTDAIVQGANLSSTTPQGFSAAQLYSTASYKAKNLAGIRLWGNDLSGWDFSGQNLTNVKFSNSVLIGANLTAAIVKGADFTGLFFSPPWGPSIPASPGMISSAQLYSTASYHDKDLSGITLGYNDLSDWNFYGQNLTNASFASSKLTGANFTGAIIRGANFSGTRGFTQAQLRSTASYQAKDLAGIGLAGINLNNWDFRGQNLTNAYFGDTSWNMDLSEADTRGASIQLYYAVKTNTILQDGKIQGLNLSGGRTLIVRDYDGSPPFDGHTLYIPTHSPIPITVENGMTMGDGTLRMVFGDNRWDSTISFQPGIPISLGGTLDLTFAPGADIKSQLGRPLGLFNWTTSGTIPMGGFNNITSNYEWDLSMIYVTGQIALLAPRRANTTWTGAVSSKWNEPGNWTPGVPAAGNVIKFDASNPAHQPIIQNISSKLKLGGITFTANAGEHILGGALLQLQGDMATIASASMSDQFIANPVELASETSLVVTGWGNLALGGELRGTGALVKRGAGTMILENAATHQGQTIIDAGTLALDTTGDITRSPITNNAIFQILDGGHTLGAITGTGATEILAGSATVSSIVQNSLTVQAGAVLTIAPLAAGPLGNGSGGITPVPEPGLFVLLAAAISCVFAWHARSRSKNI